MDWFETAQEIVYGQSYLPEECSHDHTVNVRGQWKCQQCGAIYDETTLEWKQPEQKEGS